MNKNESYKNSGVKWIGEIPKHWEISKLKYISKITYGISPHQNTYNDEGDGTLLINGPAEYSKTDFGYTRPLKWTTAPQNLVPAGVLLFCLRASTGRLNITHTNLSIGRGVCSIEASMNQNFLVFCMMMIKIYIQGQMSGSVFPSVTKRDVDNFILPMPPFEEQKLIFNYLDKKTTQIDSLIEKIYKKIELLKEQRASLINQCVTKGLNPNVEMKDSGIQWIGEIPSHWNCDRVGRTTYVKGRIGWKGLKSEDFIDEGPFCVTGTDFQSGAIIWSNCYCVDEDRYREDPFIILQNDDVLITKDGTIGKVAHIREIPGSSTLNSGIFVTRPLKGQYEQRYFYWIISSSLFSEFVEFNSSGSTILHLYQNVFERFYFPIPLIKEQKLISHYLDKKTERIDSLIEKIHKKIKLLKEYRQSLISSVVTGKIRITEDMA